MSYQALARQWRPRSFQQMVGQEHVLRVLTNALDNQRLHHAYLFTGTRGVGKTTLARIFAKCLNCEAGIASIPCGTCSHCIQSDQSRFIDLIEVDAASRTKVEDTRELLDNVQYAPTSGRYKIYLIDEVHMLSTHSFNALLKTLEEPPPHIIFLLATTDPQRLPVTVLSRCLQFHLKSLSPDCITHHLKFILEQEKIGFDLPALKEIALAAEGSVRDALSLLDQAIGYSSGEIRASDIRIMLGCVEKTYIWELLNALAKRDAKALVDCIKELSEQSANFSQVLEALLSSLHRITLAQMLPETADNDEDNILALAKQLSKEDVQLYYQIALIGRRDLPLAPSQSIGFEMTLLRMLAFKPAEMVIENPGPIANKKPVATVEPKVLPNSPLSFDWNSVIPKLNLSGLTLMLANNCCLKELTAEYIHLLLDPNHSTMLNPKSEERIIQAINLYLGQNLKLKITVAATSLRTPAAIEKVEKQQRNEEALKAMGEDKTLQTLIKTFDAKIQSIES